MNIQEKEQVVEKAKARFMDCEHKVEWNGDNRTRILIGGVA